MRCNTGVDPYFLTDQHLVAEYREIPMVWGSLKHNNFKIKSEIPETFCLGKGHINFWKNKLVYLKRRWDAVVMEMQKRNFATNMTFDIPDYCPKEFLNDWSPTIEDSMIIRERILEKIMMKPQWYRWNGVYNPMTNGVVDLMYNSPVFEV